MFKAKAIDHVDFDIWEMEGNNALEKIFASLLFADWCSYALALFNKIDPTPVDLVEDFKSKLSKMT